MTEYEKWCVDNCPTSLVNKGLVEKCTTLKQAYISSVYKDAKVINIYHGTGDYNFQLNPDFPNHYNDYGSGLYTTQNLDLAKEWSLSNYNKSDNGYVVDYLLNTDRLRLLDLTKLNTLNWLSVLVENRRLDDTEVPKERVDALVRKYYVDLKPYDVIHGWRADDSYFTFVKDFINGRISLQVLERAMSLGKLGTQFCIKSPKAFASLIELRRFKSEKEYRAKFKNRDQKARQDYKLIRNSSSLTDKYILDVLRD